jgi:GWxTD domain-containing protein
VKIRPLVTSALAFCLAQSLVFCFQNTRETIAKPLSAKEKRRREDQLLKELKGPYAKWLKEDVVYLISDEEQLAWNRLSNDEEREQFIEQFWFRRDPSPDTVENELQEEHYRRIAYANERFASGIPGWKTDRGRIYIKYGPPDQNDSHASGGTYERPPEEGGGTTSTFPFEQWRYRWIEGVGSDIVIEFVDPTMTGEYRMTMDPSEKDALLMVPGAGRHVWSRWVWRTRMSALPVRTEPGWASRSGDNHPR